MIILPVVGRELRVASRRGRSYWGRMACALAAFVVVVWVWVNFGPSGNSAVRARQIFGTVAGLAFAYSLIAGILLTADSISDEKREGTLGLLFLTDLKGYDVVFGKLFASSLHSFYGLISIFPIMAIPLLLGGLTPGDLQRMVLVLIATLFFSLSLGMLASALCKQEKRARSLALGLLLLVTAGVPLLGLLMAWMEGSVFNYAFLIPSPVASFSLAYEEAAYLARSGEFWQSLALVQTISWGALALASFIVRSSWQDRPAGERKLRLRERFQTWKMGTSAQRKSYRTGLLDVNPIYWLASRDRLKPAYVFLFLGFAAALWLFLFFKYRREMMDQFVYLLTAFVLHTRLKFWVASESTRMFAEDKRSGALELTLSTPLSVREIIDGQLFAFLRQFGWPVALILVIDVTLMMLGATRRMGGDNDWVVMFLAVMVVFLADLVTLAWLGMWSALTSRNGSRASGFSIFCVLVLPWLIFFGLVTVLSVGGRGALSSGMSMIGLWFLICIALDIFLLFWSGANLYSEFRLVVSQRFESKKG